jgi:hypothetical protein
VELAALAVVRDALAGLRAETCLCLGMPTKESLLPLGLESRVAEITACNWPCNVHWSTASDAEEEELEMLRDDEAELPAPHALTTSDLERQSGSLLSAPRRH